MQQKKVPMRMCVGCRTMQPKRDLIRIVRLADDGAVVVDRRGKMPGRGAYLCPSCECLDRARKTRALERALEHAIDESVFTQLKEDLRAGE